MPLSVIDLKHIDYSELKQDVHNYITNLSTYQDITQNIDAETLDLIEGLVASYAVYSAYKTRALRRESYLSTSTLPSSVYQFARMWGYNINRYTAPQVNIKYNDVPTITLKYGDILGSFKNYELIYTGPQKKYEKGDVLQVSVGKKFQRTLAYNQDMSVYLQPQTLQSINNEVKLFVDGIQQDVSRIPEDYLVFDKPVEFSDTKYSTNVYIVEAEKLFGLWTLEPTNTIELVYIETDGYIEEIKDTDLNLDNRFVYHSIAHLGSFGDSIPKIKFVTPYYYQALRRAVTVQDYRFILMSSPLFRDVFVEKDPGIRGVYRVSVTDNTKNHYDLTVSEYNFSDTYNVDNPPHNDEDILIAFYNQMTVNNNILIELREESGEYYLYITNKEARLDPFNVTGSEGLNIELVTENVAPLCCTLLCYYLKYNTTDTPIVLTSDERQQVSDFIRLYQMAGTSIIFIPARKEVYDLNIEIKIDDSSYLTEVTEKVNSIIDQFELQINDDFKYGELLALLGGIEHVTSVTPQQMVYDVEADGTFYIKFNRNVSVVVES